MNNKNNKNEDKFDDMIGNFVFVISLFLFTYLFIDPEFSLPKGKMWQQAVANVFVDCTNLSFGYSLTYAFGIKSEKIRLILSMIFSTVLAQVMHVTVEFKFTTQNIILLSVIGADYIFIAISVILRHKIKDKIMRTSNKKRIIYTTIWSIGVIVSIALTIVLWGVIYYKNHKFKWINI